MSENNNETYASNELIKKPILKYDYSRVSIIKKYNDLALKEIANLKSPKRLPKPNKENVPDKCGSCEKNLKNKAFYQKQLRVLEEKYKKIKRKYILCASKRSNLNYWKNTKKRNESKVTVESFIDGIADVR